MYKLTVKKVLTFPSGTFNSIDGMDRAIEEQNRVNMTISRYFNSPQIIVDAMSVTIALDILSPVEDTDKMFALEDLNILMEDNNV